MTRLSFLLLPLFCVSALLAGTPEAELEQWLQAKKKLGDVQVTLQMTRTLPTLKEPTVRVGQLFHLQDGRFRMELGSPVTTTLLFDGTQLHLLEASAKKWRSMASTSPSAKMWLMMLQPEQLTAERLTEDFTTTLTLQAGDASTITFLPKSSSLRKRLTQMDVQLQKPGPRLTQLRMIQGDNSSTVLAFEPPQSIPPATLAQLKFTPP